MPERTWQTLLRELLSSKKFVVFLVAVVLALGARVGLDLDADLVEQLVYLAIAYLVGQGLADVGKHSR